MVDSSAPADGLVAGRRRVILMTASVAVASLMLGMAAASRITSPEEAAARARPPEASRITAPVELRVVRSEVVTRGDVVYEGATDVSIATEGLATSPIVTGQIPRVGDAIESGAVVLQVVGRPVIALPGDIPAYRSLSPGLAGADVLQLKAALVALGLDPGDPAGDRYDEHTAAAVAQLYARVGYAPPRPDEALLEELEAARENVTAAEEDARMAEQELMVAGQGPPESERLAAEGAVGEAQRTLAEAEASGNAAAIADARVQLAIAEAARDELVAPRDTTLAQGATVAAQARLAEARTKVANLESQAKTPLPAAEVVFLPSLPRRVDAVLVTRGRAVDGPVMKVSGSDLVVLASLSSADGELVKADAAAQIQVGDSSVAGTVTLVRQVAAPTGDQAGGGGDQQSEGTQRIEAVIRPAPLTPEQIEWMRGENVQVTIPVQATDGEVLAVPLAALSAGPGGESRVEVQRASGRTERVVVEVGLTAGGFAEIRTTDTASLEEGDRVVVGR